MEKRLKNALALLVTAALCLSTLALVAVASPQGVANGAPVSAGYGAGTVEGLLVESLGSMSIPEDGEYTLRISDVFHDGWTLIYSTNNRDISVTYDDENIHFVPDPDWYGTESIDISAYYSDGILPPPLQDERIFTEDDWSTFESYGYTATANILIDVWPVNDPPRILDTDNYRFTMTDCSEFALQDPLPMCSLFEDVDSDLVYSWTCEDSLVSASIDGNELRQIVSSGRTGEGILTVLAHDGEYVAVLDIFVSVVPRIPVPTDEDAAVEIPMEQYADPSVYKCTLEGSESVDAEMSIGIEGEHSIIFTPSPDWNGDGTAALYASPIINTINPPVVQPITNNVPEDGNIWPPAPYVEYRYYQFDVSVAAVNDPPAVRAGAVPTSLTLTEDVPSFNVLNLLDIFSDIDSVISYGAETSAGLFSPSIAFNGMLNVVPAWNAFGSDVLRLSADDGEFSVSVDVPVEIVAVNDQPSEVAAHMTVETDEDVPAEISLADLFFDGDSDLAYDMCPSINFTAEINQTTGAALVAPSTDWYGLETLVFVAGDGEGETAMNVTFIVYPVNDPPSISTVLGEMSMQEDGHAELDLTSHFQDCDSSLAFVASVTECGVGASIEDCVLRLMPDRDWNGDCTVTITASDGEHSTLASLVVSVLAVNDPPTLARTPADLSIDEDGFATMSMTELFSDPDSTLSYSASGMNSISATVSGSVLTISAPVDWCGEETITLNASDGQDSAVCNFTATFAAVNDPPRLRGRMAAITLEVGASKTVDLSTMFHDPDGDILVYAINAPDGFATRIDHQNGLGEITAPDDWSGAIEITIAASDGVATSTEVVDVVVARASMDQAGLSMDVGYAMGGGLIAASSLAAIGLSLYAAEAAKRWPRRVRVRRRASSPA
jgi:hypothetical protein